MSRYVISFTIECSEEADPSSVLDAAEQAVPGLLSHLESVAISATIDENGPCVEAEPSKWQAAQKYRLFTLGELRTERIAPGCYEVECDGRVFFVVSDGRENWGILARDRDNIDRAAYLDTCSWVDEKVNPRRHRLRTFRDCKRAILAAANAEVSR